MLKTKLLTVSEVARRLAVPPSWVRDHATGCRRPALPSIKLGKSFRFEESAITDWLKALRRRNKKDEEIESTDVNFQVLRRTCATLFGAKAKDPRDTQAQLRHSDPAVTLRQYQKSIPASVRAAALALEEDLMGTAPKSIEQDLNRSDFNEEP